MRRADAAVTDSSARLGNVSGVALATAGCDADQVAALEAILRRAVVEVRSKRCQGTLSDWIEAVGVSEADRVLVAVAGTTAPRLDRVLALTAWPEGDALVWSGEGGARLALFRPSAVLDAAKGAAPMDAWLDAVGAAHLDDATLGLGGDVREVY